MTTTATDDRRLWSVTSLIGAGLGKGEALIGWAARVTAERAYDKAKTLAAYKEDGDRNGAVEWLTAARYEKSGSAAARGVSVHKILEEYALGKTPDYPAEFEPYAVQVRRYLDEHQPVFEAAEAPVYNLTMGYAGTLDSIQVIGGARCIVDCKTTDKGPDAVTARGNPASRPPYPEIALQLVAYRRAELIGLTPAVMRQYSGRRYYIYDPALEYTPMPAVDGVLALVVSPADYQLVPVRADDEVWEAFGYVREAARWQLETSKRVIGPAITPTPKEA